MRWNLKFRSYPDVDAQRFAAPNLHSTCAKIHFGDYRVWQALQGMCDIGHRRWGRASLQILDISTPKSATPEKSSSIFAVPIVGGTPRVVLKDVNIWNVQCARLPSTVCMYSTTKGNVVETYRFDVKSGKSTGTAQIDPPCNWSLSPDGSQRAVIPVGVNEGTIQFRSTSSDKTHDLVVKGWSGLSSVDWSVDGKSLLLPWHNHDRESALLKVALDGKVSVLLRSSNFIAFAIPSPDGRLLAISEVSLAKNAWQMENFR